MELQIKKILIIIIITLFIPSYLWAACSGGSPTWTCTADTSSTDLQNCITEATAGDTINVGEGTGTWNTRIEITKAVNLIGAGINKTIINNTYTPSLSGGSIDPTKYLISIIPATPSDNPLIRISGFKFNFDTTSYGIYYRNNSTKYDCTNVRLDHLDISASSYVFVRYGLSHGVMDNCIIKGQMDGAGDYNLWTTNGYEYGTISNFYVEDSVWSGYSETSESGFRIEGNGAFRYAFRHNTIIIPTGAQVTIFDQHGNQYGQQSSCFGAEIYDNTIIANNTGHWVTRIYNQRGGKSLVYNNTITWTSDNVDVSFHIKEEHLDSDGEGAAINAITGQPQHVSDTYYWGNSKNGNPSITTYLIDDLSIGIPKENVHVWLEKSSFDGTAGVGVGLRAARPANCSVATAVGVGYWATDEKILYRCTATNTWTAYYTPYTYPHPLRGSNRLSGGVVAGGTF